MKKLFRRNKPLVYLISFLIVINMIIFYLWIKKGFFRNLVIINAGLGKNLMTIDTVLIGFSYTALNTMLSFSNSDKFITTDKDGYIDKYFNGVYISIFLLFISMGVGFITGYSVLGEKYHSIFMIQFLLNFDSIGLFGYTLIKFHNLINWVRARKIKDLNDRN